MALAFILANAIFMQNSNELFMISCVVKSERGKSFG